MRWDSRRLAFPLPPHVEASRQPPSLLNRSLIPTPLRAPCVLDTETRDGSVAAWCQAWGGAGTGAHAGPSSIQHPAPGSGSRAAAGHPLWAVALPECGCAGCAGRPGAVAASAEPGTAGHDRVPGGAAQPHRPGRSAEAAAPVLGSRSRVVEEVRRSDHRHHAERRCPATTRPQHDHNTNMLAALTTPTRPALTTPCCRRTDHRPHANAKVRT